MPILQAIVDGKTIQHKTINREWYDTNVASLDHLVTYYKDYRIKPETTYRPFKDAEECWTEMQKHQPFGWVKTGESIRRLITLVDVDRIQIGNQNLNWTYAQVFKAFIFMDGQPFGVKVEE